MNTVKEEVQSILEIKKSKFITILKPISTEEEAKKVLADIKIEHPNAKHYTYAYLIDGVKKMSDDKEPSGTAGIPILTVLEHHHMNHVICIVVRYFGGILLGAPGLVRAYAGSVKTALKSASIIPFIRYNKVDITFPYERVKTIDFLLKDVQIEEKYFDTEVRYVISLPEDDPMIEELKQVSDTLTIKKTN